MWHILRARCIGGHILRARCIGAPGSLLRRSQARVVLAIGVSRASVNRYAKLAEEGSRSLRRLTRPRGSEAHFEERPAATVCERRKLLRRAAGAGRATRRSAGCLGASGGAEETDIWEWAYREPGART
jgi:hypothetical protein